MRILICINNYWPERMEFVKNRINDYLSLPYEVDVRVYTSHDGVYSQDRVQTIRTYSEGWYATWEHRKDIVRLVDEYDLFIVVEDDITVSHSSIEAFWGLDLPDEYIPGFIVIEGDYIISMNTAFEPSIESRVTIAGRDFFTPVNLASAMFMAKKQHLLRAIQSGEFDEYPRAAGRDYGVPEWSMVNIYVGCGMQKVIPVDDLDNFFVKHEDKYSINYPTGRWYTKDDLRLILRENRSSL